MSYAYLPGETQPSGIVVNGPDQAVAGCAIGILVLDLRYPLFPGNVANASTWRFPVMYEVLKGTGVEILDADPSILPKLIEGGRKLEAQGVRAIVGSCGYFGFYQKEAAAAFRVPTFMSSLLQVPAILTSLNPDQKLGVICAAAESINDKILGACGIHDDTRLVVAGARELPEFKNIIGCTGQFDSSRLEREMVALSQDFVNDHPDIGAILLECSDMPPYAYAIQNAVKRPVFDFITLVNWIHSSVVRGPIAGHI
jgi:hypothetical protein